MRKFTIVGAIVVAAVIGTAGTATADEHEEPPSSTLHPHALVIGAGGDEFTGFTAVTCVDLAAGEPVPLNAHHAHIHAGVAGEALFTNTSNFAIPLQPYVFAPPANNCDELFELFGVTIVRGKSGNHGPS